MEVQAAAALGLSRTPLRRAVGRCAAKPCPPEARRPNGRRSMRPRPAWPVDSPWPCHVCLAGCLQARNARMPFVNIMLQVGSAGGPTANAASKGDRALYSEALPTRGAETERPEKQLPPPGLATGFPLESAAHAVPLGYIWLYSNMRHDMCIQS